MTPCFFIHPGRLCNYDQFIQPISGLARKRASFREEKKKKKAKGENRLGSQARGVWELINVDPLEGVKQWDGRWRAAPGYGTESALGTEAGLVFGFLCFCLLVGSSGQQTFNPVADWAKSSHHRQICHFPPHSPPWALSRLLSTLCSILTFLEL